MRITMQPGSRTHNLNDNDRWWPARLFPLWVFVMQSMKAHGVQTAPLPPCCGSGDGRSFEEEQKGSLWSRAVTTKPLQPESFPGLGWLRTLWDVCPVPHPALAGQAQTWNRLALPQSLLHALVWGHCCGFPSHSPRLCLSSAAAAHEGASWGLAHVPCFSTLGFASEHPASALLPPRGPPQTCHRAVGPLGGPHLHPEIRGPSLCMEVEEHLRSLALCDRLACQQQDSLRKLEGKNLVWGTKRHKHLCVI